MLDDRYWVVNFRLPIEWLKSRERYIDEKEATELFNNIIRYSGSYLLHSGIESIISIKDNVYYLKFTGKHKQVYKETIVLNTCSSAIVNCFRDKFKVNEFPVHVQLDSNLIGPSDKEYSDIINIDIRDNSLVISVNNAGCLTRVLFN